MSRIRVKFTLLYSSCLTFAAALSGCGDEYDCSMFPDPTGLWTGVLERTESDCGALSRGTKITFQHEVSTECDANNSAFINLVNEDNRRFQETSVDTISGSSFSVRSTTPDSTLDISYDNFDSSLADVSEKVRVYNQGKLVCSERYKGQARRR